MNKPGRISAKPLSALLGDVFSDAFAKQGFASREIVTRWKDIAGARIGEVSEPIKIQWPRAVGDNPPDPATLILRVDGPLALEIQHSSDVIRERVNRFFGWNAIGKITIRQGPLSQHKQRRIIRDDPVRISQEAAQLHDVQDEDLRLALARLAARVKRN